MRAVFLLLKFANTFVGKKANKQEEAEKLPTTCGSQFW